MSEFRNRLLAGSAEHLLPERCRQARLLRQRGQQCTDATHVLGRWGCSTGSNASGEAMRHALNSLAVVTQVGTTIAAGTDNQTFPQVQADLAARDLLPGAHLVEGGYVDAGLLVQSQAQGIGLGPPAPTPQDRQARADQGFDLPGLSGACPLHPRRCRSTHPARPASSRV